MTNGRPVPVSLGRPRQGQPCDFAAKPPLIFVHVARDDHSPHNGVTYRAMLDSGAESTCVDRELIAECGLEFAGNAMVHGMDNAAKPTTLAKAQIILPAQNVIFVEHVAAVDFRSAGQAFDLVLGRSFLRHCVFEVDGPNERYTLHWVA